MKYNPYSSSKLIVAKCPYRFRRHYVDKDIGDTSSQASKKGNVIHECYEELIRGMADGIPVDPAKIPALVNEKIIKFKLIDESFIKKCHVAVMNILTIDFPVKINNLVDTEEMLALKRDANNAWVSCEWDDPDAYFRGKIDVLYIDDDGYGVYVDHKTQMNKEKDPATRQMKLYAFLVMRTYPQLKGVRSFIHYADPALNRMGDPASFSKEDIREIETDLMNTVSAVEALSNKDLKVANTGEQCLYCSIKDDCTVLKNLPPSKKVIVSMEEARESVGTIYALGLQLNDMKKQLQLFCKNYEVQVEKSGIVTGYFLTEGWDVPNSEDKEKMFELLKSNGLNPYDYVKIDTRALKKSAMFLKQEPIDEIRSLLTRTSKTSFRTKKV